MKPFAAWAEVMAVLAIASASAGGQVAGSDGVRTWIPYLATIAMLLTALAGQPRHRAWSSRGRWMAGVVVCGAIMAGSSIQASGSVGAAEALRLLPLLVGAAAAEEIIFREDLPAALADASALRGLPERRRRWVAAGLSQVAFAVAHLPALSVGYWQSKDGVELGVGIATTLAFGFLMAGMRMAGAGLTMRTIHHSVVNFVSIAVPVGLMGQVARLLGATVAVLAVLAARTSRRPRRSKPWVVSPAGRQHLP